MPVPHRRTPRAFTGHDAATLDRMVDLLERSGGSDIDRDALRSDLLGAIHATGLAHDGSAEAVLWQSFAAAEPGLHEFREVFSRAAGAENPLSPEVLPRHPSGYTIALDRLLRVRWEPAWRKAGHADRPRVRTLRRDALDETGRGEIRGMLRELAARADAQIGPGRPRTGDLDTVMPMIAVIFLRHGARNRDDWPDLETGAETIIVQFLECALAGTAAPGETTRDALSRRWGRLIRAERAFLRDMEREWAEAAGTAGP